MMKKLCLFGIMMVSSFVLIGCGHETEKDSKVPVGLKEVTGKIVEATLDQNHNIVINEEDVTKEVVILVMNMRKLLLVFWLFEIVKGK